MIFWLHWIVLLYMILTGPPEDWKTQNSLIYHGWQLVLVLFRSAAEAFHQRSLILLHLNLGEGNGTPLQYSCLENPTDGGAW